MAIDVDLRSWDFVPADDDWGDIFAIDLGRWRPELHPRDSHGRFRNSWRLPDAAMAQVERLLRGFNPPPLRSDAHAASYLKGQRGPRSKKQQEALDYFLSRAGNEDIQSTLRGGYDPRRPEPQSARISELDAMMRPLEHDLILSRVLGPDAFGLPPERLGEVEEWTGRRVNDKGFSPMNAGTAYPVSGPHIEMRVLVPKGTKAIIVGSGDPNDPNGRTVILSREQPLRIGKVEKDGKGGFYALATVAPTRGAKGEQPTTGLGKDLPAAQRSPAIEATPDEFQRRGLEPEAPPGPQEQPDRFGPVTPAGPAPVARAAPAAAPPAPTPAPQGPPLEQPSPAKAIREAGGRVPTGAGRVTDESTLNAPEAPAPTPRQRGGRQVIPEEEARLRDRQQRLDAQAKEQEAREKRLQAAQEQLLLAREREIQRKDAEIERLQAQREADIAGRTIRADEGTQARLERLDSERNDAVVRADERNRKAPGWPANGEDTRIAEHANRVRRERGEQELPIPADAPPATPMEGEIPALVKRARKVAAKAAPEGAPEAAPAKRVRKAAKAAPEAAPGAPEAAPEAPAPAKRVRKVAQKAAPEAAPEAAAPEAPPARRVRKAATKAVPEAAPEAAPAAPPVKKAARVAKAAAPEAAVPEGEKDLRGISYEDALKLPPEQWQQRLRQIQDDLKFMKEARKAAPEGAPEAPPAKKAARVVKKAAPEAPEAPPVKKVTRGAKKAAPEAAPEAPAKKAAVKRAAKKVAPEAVKAVPEKKVYPERQPKTMKELQDMKDDEIIRYADSLEGPAQNSAEVVAKRMAQAARIRKEEGAPPGETIAERVKRQARPSPEAKPRPRGLAKTAEQIRAENEASKAETRRLEEKAFPERKRPVAKKRGPGKTAEQIRAENEASKAETARLAKKLPAKTPMTQEEREAKEKLPSPTAKKAANKLVKLRAEAFDKNVPNIPGEDGIALRRAQKQLAEGRAVSEVKQDLNDRAEFLRRAAEIEREDPNDLTGRRAVHLDQLADTYERAADMAGKRGPNPDRLTPGDKVERTNKDKSITKGTVAKRGRLTYIDWEDGESQRVLPSRPGRGIKKVGGAEPGVEAPKAAKPPTLVELRKEAGTLNVPGRSRMDRPQLEEALAARRKKEGESDEEHAARLAKLNERPTVTRAAPRKVAKAREAAPEAAPEAPAAAKKAAAKKTAKPSIEDHAANALLEAMPPEARKAILESMTPDERTQVEEAVQRVKGAAARPTVKRAVAKKAATKLADLTPDQRRQYTDLSPSEQNSYRAFLRNGRSHNDALEAARESVNARTTRAAEKANAEAEGRPVKRAARKVARAAERPTTSPLPAHEKPAKAAEKSVAKLVPHGTDGGSIPNKRAPKATGVQAPTKAAKVARPRVTRAAAPAITAERVPTTKEEFRPGGAKHLDVRSLSATEGIDKKDLDDIQRDLDEGKTPGSLAKELRHRADVIEAHSVYLTHNAVSKDESTARPEAIAEKRRLRAKVARLRALADQLQTTRRPVVRRAAARKAAPEAPPAPEVLQDNSKADFRPGGAKHIDLEPLTEGLDFSPGPGEKEGKGAPTVGDLAIVPDHRGTIAHAQQELNEGKSPASVAHDLRGNAQALRNVASIRFGGWGEKDRGTPESRAELKQTWTNWYKRAEQFDKLATKLEATKRPRVARKAAVAKAAPEVSAPERPTVTRAARKVAKAAPEAPARLQRSPRLTPEQQNDIADLKPIDKARYRSLRRDRLSHDDALAQTKRERQSADLGAAARQEEEATAKLRAREALDRQRAERKAAGAKQLKEMEADNRKDLAPVLDEAGVKYDDLSEMQRVKVGVLKARVEKKTLSKKRAAEMLREDGDDRMAAIARIIERPAPRKVAARKVAKAAPEAPAKAAPEAAPETKAQKIRREIVESQQALKDELQRLETAKGRPPRKARSNEQIRQDIAESQQALKDELQRVEAARQAKKAAPDGEVRERLRQEEAVRLRAEIKDAIRNRHNVKRRQLQDRLQGVENAGHAEDIAPEEMTPDGKQAWADAYRQSIRDGYGDEAARRAADTDAFEAAMRLRAPKPPAPEAPAAAKKAARKVAKAAPETAPEAGAVPKLTPAQRAVAQAVADGTTGNTIRADVNKRLQDAGIIEWEKGKPRLTDVGKKALAQAAGRPTVKRAAKAAVPEAPTPEAPPAKKVARKAAKAAPEAPGPGLLQRVAADLRADQLAREQQRGIMEREQSNIRIQNAVTHSKRGLPVGFRGLRPYQALRDGDIERLSKTEIEGMTKDLVERRDAAPDLARKRAVLKELDRLHGGHWEPPGEAPAPTKAAKKVAKAAPEVAQAPARKAGARRISPIDSVSIYGTEGESGLRERLSGMDLEQLRDVIAGEGMDPSRHLSRTRDKGRLADWIVERSRDRSTKGNAFRTPPVPEARKAAPERPRVTRAEKAAPEAAPEVAKAPPAPPAKRVIRERKPTPVGEESKLTGKLKGLGGDRDKIQAELDKDENGLDSLREVAQDLKLDYVQPKPDLKRSILEALSGKRAPRKVARAPKTSPLPAHEPAAPAKAARAAPNVPENMKDRVRPGGMITAAHIQKGDRVMVEKGHDGNWHPSTRITTTPITVDRQETIAVRNRRGGIDNRRIVIGHDDQGNEIRIGGPGNEGYTGTRAFRAGRPVAAKAAPEAAPARPKVTRAAAKKAVPEAAPEVSAKAAPAKRAVKKAVPEAAPETPAPRAPRKVAAPRPRASAEALREKVGQNRADLEGRLSADQKKELDGLSPRQRARYWVRRVESGDDHNSALSKATGGAAPTAARPVVKRAAAPRKVAAKAAAPEAPAKVQPAKKLTAAQQRTVDGLSPRARRSYDTLTSPGFWQGQQTHQEAMKEARRVERVEGIVDQIRNADDIKAVDRLVNRISHDDLSLAESIATDDHPTRRLAIGFGSGPDEQRRNFLRNILTKRETMSKAAKAAREAREAKAARPVVKRAAKKVVPEGAPEAPAARKVAKAAATSGGYRAVTQTGLPRRKSTDLKAKEWGTDQGYKGATGGWLSKGGKKTDIQGWDSLYKRHGKEIEDWHKKNVIEDRETLGLGEGLPLAEAQDWARSNESLTNLRKRLRERQASKTARAAKKAAPEAGPERPVVKRAAPRKVAAKATPEAAAPETPPARRVSRVRYTAALKEGMSGPEAEDWARRDDQTIVDMRKERQALRNAAPERPVVKRAAPRKVAAKVTPEAAPGSIEERTNRIAEGIGDTPAEKRGARNRIKAALEEGATDAEARNHGEHEGTVATTRKEVRATVRQRRIARKRETATLLGEVDDLLRSDASDRALQHRIKSRAGVSKEFERTDINDVRDRLLATGTDREKMRAEVKKLAQEAGIKRIGESGQVVPFDPAKHHPGGDASIKAGTPVQITRPGYEWNEPGGTLGNHITHKATVFEAAEAPSAKRPRVTRAAKKAVPKTSPLQAHEAEPEVTDITEVPHAPKGRKVAKRIPAAIKAEPVPEGADPDAYYRARARGSSKEVATGWARGIARTRENLAQQREAEREAKAAKIAKKTPPRVYGEEPAFYPRKVAEPPKTAEAPKAERPTIRRVAKKVAAAVTRPFKRQTTEKVKQPEAHKPVAPRLFRDTLTPAQLRDWESLGSTDERATYQRLVKRGMSHEAAMEAAPRIRREAHARGLEQEKARRRPRKVAQKVVPEAGAPERPKVTRAGAKVESADDVIANRGTVVRLPEHPGWDIVQHDGNKRWYILDPEGKLHKDGRISSSSSLENAQKRLARVAGPPKAAPAKRVAKKAAPEAPSKPEAAEPSIAQLAKEVGFKGDAAGIVPSRQLDLDQGMSRPDVAKKIRRDATNLEKSPLDQGSTDPSINRAAREDRADFVRRLRDLADRVEGKKTAPERPAVKRAAKKAVPEAAPEAPAKATRTPRKVAAKATPEAAAPERPVVKRAAPRKVAAPESKELKPLANGTRRKSMTNVQEGDVVRGASGARGGSEVPRQVTKVERDGNSITITRDDGSTLKGNANTAVWLGEAPKAEAPAAKRAVKKAAPSAPEAPTKATRPRVTRAAKAVPEPEAKPTPKSVANDPVKLRRHAATTRQLGEMRMANNAPGSAHYKRGQQDLVDANRMDREADALEKAAAPAKKVAAKRVPAKKAAPEAPEAPVKATRPRVTRAGAKKAAPEAAAPEAPAKAARPASKQDLSNPEVQRARGSLLHQGDRRLSDEAVAKEMDRLKRQDMADQRRLAASPRTPLDQNVSLRGDPQGDGGVMHGDSPSMQLAQKLAKRGDRNGSANKVMEMRQSYSGSAGTKDLDASQRAVDELRLMRLEEKDPAVRKMYDEAIARMDAEHKPVPDLPQGTPQSARKLISDLNRIPLARRAEGNDLEAHPSAVDELAQIYHDIDSGKLQSSAEIDSRVERVLRRFHESRDGAYQMWHLDPRGTGQRSSLSRDLRQWARDREAAGPHPSPTPGSGAPKVSEPRTDIPDPNEPRVAKAQKRLQAREAHHRRSTADGSGELADMLNQVIEARQGNDDPAAFRRAVRQRLLSTPGEKTDPKTQGYDDLRKALTGESFTNPEELGTRLRQELAKRGITMTSTPGTQTRFNPDLHRSVGGDIPDNADVQVIRPGLIFTDKDGTVVTLQKPVVKRVTTSPMASVHTRTSKGKFRDDRSAVTKTLDRAVDKIFGSPTRPTVKRAGAKVTSSGTSHRSTQRPLTGKATFLTADLFDRDTDPRGVPVRDFTPVLGGGYTIKNGTAWRRNGVTYVVEHDETGEGKRRAIEAAKALEHHHQSLPAGARRYQKSYVWNNGSNPEDPEFAKKHGVDRFTSVMTAGGGETHIWQPGVKMTPEGRVDATQLMSDLNHEYGHNADVKVTPRGTPISETKNWHDAGTNADPSRYVDPRTWVPSSAHGGRAKTISLEPQSGTRYPHGVTAYGRSSDTEDFAEAVSLYLQGRIGYGQLHDQPGFSWLWFRDLFPERAAILDKLFPEVARQQRDEIAKLEASPTRRRVPTRAKPS